MFQSRFRLVAGTLLGVLALVTGASSGRCQEAVEGVEVQARGPVHEAYAESVGAPAQPTPVVAKAPPDPIEEMPPDQRPAGDNVQWIPGYWAWDETRTDYLWVSGFWRVPPPGREWTPGHWRQADAGWQWAPGFWDQQETKEVAYLPPPPAPLEAQPSVPAPGADYSYVPGCWVYRDGRYVWRPGVWVACQPNWMWVPAHYAWTPCGYVYVEGYWDYPLQNRGLLFAPVVVDVRVCRPGFVYTPCFVVQHDVLVGAMFVRPGVSCYYFGDYFDPGCRQAGYVAWVDVRVGGGYDPMFAYYRYENRGSPGWEISIRANYGGMYNGTIAPPGRTVVVNNVTINNTTIINRTSMVTSITQVNKNVVKLQPVSHEERLAAHARAQRVVEASRERGKAEKEVLAKGPPPRAGEAPRTAARTSSGLAAPKAAAHSEAVNHGAPQPGHPANQPEHPSKPAEHTTPNAHGQPGHTPASTPGGHGTQPGHPSGTQPGQTHPPSGNQPAHPQTTPPAKEPPAKEPEKKPTDSQKP